jgi:hypothetical protein
MCVYVQMPSLRAREGEKAHRSINKPRAEAAAASSRVREKKRGFFALFMLSSDAHHMKNRNKMLRYLGEGREPSKKCGT